MSWRRSPEGDTYRVGRKNGFLVYQLGEDNPWLSEEEFLRFNERRRRDDPSYAPSRREQSSLERPDPSSRPSRGEPYSISQRDPPSHVPTSNARPLVQERKTNPNTGLSGSLFTLFPREESGQPPNTGLSGSLFTLFPREESDQPPDTGSRSQYASGRVDMQTQARENSGDSYRVGPRNPHDRPVPSRHASMAASDETEPHRHAPIPASRGKEVSRRGDIDESKSYFVPTEDMSRVNLDELKSRPGTIIQPRGDGKVYIRERRDKNKDDTPIEVYDSGRRARAEQTRQPSNRRETKDESAVAARRISQSAPLVSSKERDPLYDSLKDVPSRPNYVYISVFKKDGKPKDVAAMIDTGSPTSNCISENLYVSIGIRHDGAHSVLKHLSGGESRVLGRVELEFRILNTDYAGRPGAFQRGGKSYSARFCVVPGALPHMVISGQLEGRLNLLKFAVVPPPSVGQRLEKAALITYTQQEYQGLLNTYTEQEYQGLPNSLRSQQQGQSGYEDPPLARPRPPNPPPPKPIPPPPKPPKLPKPPKPSPYGSLQGFSDYSSSGDEKR